MPGACDTDQVSQVEYLRIILPRQDLRQGVGSGDEVELGAGVLGDNIVESIDCVCRTTAINIHPRDGEMRIRSGGDDRHEVAVLRRCDTTVLLERLIPSRREEDLIKSEGVLHL